MKFSNPNFEQKIPIVPVTLVGVILVIMFPCLFIVENIPIGGKEYPKDILNLFFGGLIAITLLLSGICVSMWPAKAPPNKQRQFHKRYKILPPLPILSERQRRPKKLAKPLAVESTYNETKPRDKLVPFHKWTSLRLFPGKESDRQDSLLDLISNAVLLIDNEGKILETNCSAEKVLGWSSQDMRETPVTDILPKLFPDAENEAAFEKFSFRGTQSEVFGILRETFCINKDGLRKNVKLRMSKQEAYDTLVIAIEIIQSSKE